MILNSVFELLNFGPIWMYIFWTLELLLYWTLYVQIKEEFKSSKIIYWNRPKFKISKIKFELFLYLISKRKCSRVQNWDMTKVKSSKVLKNTLYLQNKHFIQQLKWNWVFLNKCDLSLFLSGGDASTRQFIPSHPVET